MPETGLFSILDSVDSTNNYAMAAIHAGLASHGMAWFANEQTAGKGQRGKQWQTGNSENIALSIVLEPRSFSPLQPFKISVAIGLACFDFFSSYAGSDTSIKWPNDMYWRDRKAGGILIENLVRGNEWKFSVAGIGININQSGFDAALKNPVSLAQITHKNYDTIELARELYDAVIKRFDELSNGGFDEMLAAYNRHLYKINQPARLRKGTRVFEVMIKGVSPQGKLIAGNDAEAEMEFGEVEWLTG
jgi:BirA family transcriptional regulator, biotin operon repressor / biotin---[acetyl-CoA-carboxylase] ligase